MTIFNDLQEKPLPPDHLPAWHRENDPLRYRQGLSNVQYASATQRFDRIARRIPERVLDWATAFIVGASLGILLACKL